MTAVHQEPHIPAHGHDVDPTLPEPERRDPAIWLRQGDGARDAGRWDDAAAAYRQAIDVAPRLAEAWVGLAHALITLQRVEEGMAAGHTALDLAPSLPAAHRTLALGWLRRRCVDKAEMASLDALRLAPEYPEGLATLALVRMMQGRPDDADGLFRKALAAKPAFAEALANHAATLVRLNRAPDAVRAAERAIALKAFLSGPHVLLGGLWRKTGHINEAIAAYGRAVRADPGHVDARLALVDSLRQGGFPREAVAACRQGLDRQADDTGLLACLGDALHALSDHAGAAAAYHHALALRPDQPEIENNLARIAQDLERPGRALRHLERAFAIRPDDGEIAGNLTAARLAAGDRSGALAAARAALRRVAGEKLAGEAPPDTASPDAASPGRGPALSRLGQALAHLDQPGEAEVAFAAAIAADPGNADIRLQAGLAFLHTGRRPLAVPYIRQAIRLDPRRGRNWAMLGQALRGLRLNEPDEALRADLLEALRQPAAENTHLVEVIASAIALNPALRRLRDVTVATPAETDGDTAVVALPGDAAVTALLGDVALHDLARDDLLIGLLDNAVVTDPSLERDLTRLRRVLLGLARPGGKPRVTVLDHPDWQGFLCALARQCFLNEYAFAETPAETAAIDALLQHLLITVDHDVAPIPAHVALIAAYRPLHRWPALHRLADHRWPDDMARLVDLQIRNPLAEAALDAQIPRLTAIRDGVSASVRAQYEESPHPRWLHAGLLDEPLPVPRVLGTMFPHVTLASGPWWDAPEVLIAGCGTGREAVWAANQFKGARVLAVDLSRASLAYARRQSERLGLDTVTYAQADLMELGGLDRTFDVIQSVGVLHHLADPLAGWQGLTRLLRPHGVMKIGLYSERARRAVIATRAFIAARGYAHSPEGIRRFRQDALALPPDHPVKPVTRSADFYSTSACRDLLFHVQEHRMTVPQIADWLDTLGLEFLGFQLEDPTSAHLYRARFPEDPAMTALASWDRFETELPHTFGGLYQFWVRRRG